MKRLIAFALAVVMLAALCACGEYQQAVISPEQESGTEPDLQPEQTTSPEEQDPGYTVTLTYNGKPFAAPEGLMAQWTDGFSYHTAPFSGSVAAAGELDGDYRVTLSALPEGFTYDPNAYTARTDAKQVEIELFKVEIPRGSGSDEYHCIALKKTNYYRVTFTRPGQQVFFEFLPTSPGTYVIESLVDTAAQQYNPIMTVYSGSAQYKLLDHRQDGGGAEDGYTKNFRHVIHVNEDQIGMVFTFAVEMESKSDESLYYLDFALTLDGTYHRQDTVAVMQMPKDLYVLMIGHVNRLRAMTPEQFCQTVEVSPEHGIAIYERLNTLKFTTDEQDFDQSVQNLYDVLEFEYYEAVSYYLKHIYDEFGTYVGAETVKNGRNVFDGSRYALNPETGVYHVYDMEEYASTNGFGPILYADIVLSCRFLSQSFSRVEYEGNNALTLASGTKNYKQFIEGFDALVMDPSSASIGPYLCVNDCPCRLQGKCLGACLESCSNCHPDCRKVLPWQIKAPGYADVTNAHGRFPVTPELKNFLQEYCISQLLFCDGNGWAEENPDVKVDAAEDDQWLFACGYYLN